MEYYRNFQTTWKDREFSIMRQQTGNCVRTFTAIEAYALQIHIEKLKYQRAEHPGRINEVCEHCRISKQKFYAMGKRIFNEVKWDRCTYPSMKDVKKKIAPKSLKNGKP